MARVQSVDDNAVFVFVGDANAHDSDAKATPDKQMCFITHVFVNHDQWSLVKAGNTTIL